MRPFLTGVISFCLLLGLFLTISSARAQSTQTTQNSQNTASQGSTEAQNAEIARLEAEIASYKDQLAKTQSAGDSLSNAIKEIDLNQKKLEADAKLIQEKMDKANRELKHIGVQITDKKDAIKGLISAVNDGIRRLDEGDHTSFLIYLMREESITDAWREFDAIRTIEQHLNSNIESLTHAQADLEEKKSGAEAEKKQILGLKSDLDVQKKIVTANKSEKERLLSATKNQESAYKKMIADSEKKKADFEKSLRKLEEGISYTLNIKDLPTGIAFAWPLEKIIITQKFGVTASSGRLYKSGSHNGVDFGAAIGTPVYAMADGTVEGTGDTDIQCPRVSFGRFVLIKYSNGLASTYGHLSVIVVTKGQSVQKGQLVGYSGNTGYSTGPHLHVSVYPRDAVDLKTLPSISCKGKVLTQTIASVNAYLDPLKYLPK